ncbi:hypothetical protein [uncultured Roseibium sp.]|uniref:hypothetical protein n=1 Tax=uncultured Roseibium sp. TaxID=1936171 RepID=UPI0026201348|nr:hypothetical protein [uncultured Roseibium sp.]
MALRATVDADDPTIDTLAQSDKRLGIRCDYCGRFRYLKISKFSGSQKVSDLSSGLTCAKCGAAEVNAVVVSRDPESGYWPAESS